MLIKLNCLGGCVFVDTDHIPEDSFLSKLIEWEEGKTEFDVSEPKEIVSNLMASIKYGTIIDDNISLKHMLLLAKSWCFPEEILNQFEEEIKIHIEKEPIQLCKVCGIGFKHSENTNTSCKLHTGKFSLIAKQFDCCGNRELNEYCKIGYHVAVSGEEVDLP